MKEQELKFKIKELRDKINVPEGLLPEINQSNDYAKPFIDIGSGDVFYYVIRERGIEYERILFKNEDEFLYRIFDDVTFVMAKEYELKHRDDNQDFRIILFKKQEELMSHLENDWGIRKKFENDKYF